jgi:hypothetical protein
MIKISYQKEWDENGTVYTQTINTTGKDSLKIASYLNEIYEKTLKNNNNNLYFRHLAETPKQYNKTSTKYFLNLTQLKHIQELLNNKRILIRNTILKFTYC